MSNRVPSPSLAPSQRRLQRAPDFTGGRIRRFRGVFLRHGLPGLLLALALLAAPDLRTLLWAVLTPALSAPGHYLLIACGILALLIAVSTAMHRRLDAAQVGWILYLLALSFWEEWIFRLALPATLGTLGLGAAPAILVSNLLFGALHYFTLRWKLHWCLLATLGGLWFANAMQAGDLALVVALHWVTTWFNTPRPPNGTRPDLEAGQP